MPLNQGIRPLLMAAPCVAPAVVNGTDIDNLQPFFAGAKNGGGSLTRLEPETKGLVKKRMTIDEYLEHQLEEEKAYSKEISNILDSEMEVWIRVHWRLSEELFLFWYIWLKDNTAVVEEFVEEVKSIKVT